MTGFAANERNKCNYSVAPLEAGMVSETPISTSTMPGLAALPKNCIYYALLRQNLSYDFIATFATRFVKMTPSPTLHTHIFQIHSILT